MVDDQGTVVQVHRISLTDLEPSLFTLAEGVGHTVVQVSQRGWPDGWMGVCYAMVLQRLQENKHGPNVEDTQEAWNGKDSGVVSRQ